MQSTQVAPKTEAVFGRKLLSECLWRSFCWPQKYQLTDISWLNRSSRVWEQAPSSAPTPPLPFTAQELRKQRRPPWINKVVFSPPAQTDMIVLVRPRHWRHSETNLFSSYLVVFILLIDCLSCLCLCWTFLSLCWNLQDFIHCFFICIINICLSVALYTNIHLNCSAAVPQTSTRCCSDQNRSLLLM